MVPSLDFTKVKDYNSDEDNYYEESVKQQSPILVPEIDEKFLKSDLLQSESERHSQFGDSNLLDDAELEKFEENYMQNMKMMLSPSGTGRS